MLTDEVKADYNDVVEAMKVEFTANANTIIDYNLIHQLKKKHRENRLEPFTVLFWNKPIPSP